MSPIDTIEYVRRTGCSVARFGDGEFALAFSGSIGFQDVSAALQDELMGVLAAPPASLLVCVPYCFSLDGISQLKSKDARGWRRFAVEYFPRIRNLIAPRMQSGEEIVYGDSLISRPYMIWRNRVSHAEEVFCALKSLWVDRDVLIVEGEKSRLGVGNDLFARSRSVRRILCPALNAYAQIDDIVAATCRHAKNALVLMALGPTATVLAARLAKLGIQAIDIGHVDVEYSWFKMHAKQKVRISGKYVHEAQDGDGLVEDCVDVDYISSIVDVVS